MNYRRLGKTNLMVSEVGLGGEWLERHNAEEVRDVIKACEENGINILDCWMAEPNVRTNIGNAIEGHRENWYIQGHVGATWQNGQYVRTRDMDKVVPAFEDLLTRLQTDYIDFYLAHSMDKDRWEKMKAMGLKEFMLKLKAEGKIKYICFSTHADYDGFEYILNDFDWDMCQIQYNYMDINNQAGTKGLKLAGEKGIPVVIMEGLLGGRLANAPDNVQALYDAFPVKRSAVEWAFRWLCNHPEVATVLSGVTTVEQTLDNLRIFDTVEAGCMDEAELKLIDDVRDAYNSRIKVGCTGCAYCMPCPGGVDIPKSFAIWNNASLFGGLEKGNAEYARLEKDDKAPTKCLECGACMANCPQSINIVEMLKCVTADLA